MDYDITQKLGEGANWILENYKPVIYTVTSLFVASIGAFFVKDFVKEYRNFKKKTIEEKLNGSGSDKL